MSQSLFFYGTLCHVPLLELVLGRSRVEISYCDANLADHLATWVKDEPFPMIAEQSGASAQGILVQDLSETDIARLRFYEGGFEYDLKPVHVSVEGGSLPAKVFFPKPGRWQQGQVWDLQVWAAQWGRLSLNTAREVMQHYANTSVDEIARLLPFLRARAWAKELARDPAPSTLRRDMPASTVSLEMRDDGYAGFFRLDTFDVAYPRFDGAQSETLERGAFVAYDAALVLPYDPARDLVMLIEQMRYGPLLRSDPLPWMLEPIAGLVDAGEAPIETARREAVEEAGLALQDIRPMLKVYAAPGYSTEFFHCFLGVCPLDKVQQAVHGLASEHEDIRTHVIPFEQAMALLDSGEINQAPLAMMLLWLARRRDELRSLA
ncbi:MAG: NUDIX domain-containing protein [Planktotalea sp.]|uniref:NUDIX domain-containing protein n=1 Tax=Planktotalea sp. TaxID=2029877 RepID=UPI003C732236